MGGGKLQENWRVGRKERFNLEVEQRGQSLSCGKGEKKVLLRITCQEEQA